MSGRATSVLSNPALRLDGRLPRRARGQGSARRSDGPLALLPGGRRGARGSSSQQPRTGRVILVGAGPGDPELITVRGLRLLRAADVVLYDRLVDRALLDEARSDALLFDVGKRPGQAAVPQEEIALLLIAHARAGRLVVRLKGGDPFVYGRGGEEAIACAEAGIPCQVVPGLSSALAAPCAVGIPLTHRGMASSFAVLSGHRAGESDASFGRDLEAAASIDSLVILMAVGRLDAVCRLLIAAGRELETPAAIVERATWAEERSIFATLGTISAHADAAGIRSPAALIVGPTVGVATAVGASATPAADCENHEPTATPWSAEGEPSPRPAPGGPSVSPPPALGLRREGDRR